MLLTIIIIRSQAKFLIGRFLSVAIGAKQSFSLVGSDWLLIAYTFLTNYLAWA